MPFLDRLHSKDTLTLERLIWPVVFKFCPTPFDKEALCVPDREYKLEMIERTEEGSAWKPQLGSLSIKSMPYGDVKGKGKRKKKNRHSIMSRSKLTKLGILPLIYSFREQDDTLGKIYPLVLFDANDELKPALKHITKYKHSMHCKKKIPFRGIIVDYSRECEIKRYGEIIIRYTAIWSVFQSSNI